MKRRKLTFRYASDSLAEAIRGVEQYWPCDDLRELGYNAPIEQVEQAALSDALRINAIAQEMQHVSDRLEARAQHRLRGY